jgi:hypothetical protein
MQQLFKTTPNGMRAKTVWKRVLFDFRDGCCDGTECKNLLNTTPSGMGAVTVLKMVL